MPRTYISTFTVSGGVPFPMDMLRYDECWPVSTEDAEQIRAAIDNVGRRPGYQIRLRSMRSYPTFDRWLSFGWIARDEE